jgi:very-short-patch-repair endonuclease
MSFDSFCKCGKPKKYPDKYCPTCADKPKAALPGKRRKASKFEMIVDNRLCQHWMGQYVCEYKFHPSRCWRFDFAFPGYKIAVECEGGVYINGRHNRGKGFSDDLIKYNSAVMLGWRVLRFTPQQVDLVVDAVKLLIAAHAGVLETLKKGE